VATTVNVYCVPFVRPTHEADVPVTVQTASAGVEVTVYPVRGSPPVELGAVHESTALLSPRVAVTAVGGSGNEAAITVLVTVAVESPTTF
jgi:hypothetical protein